MNGSLGFHETKAFFALWAIFIFGSTQLACLDYLSSDKLVANESTLENKYFYIICIISGIYTIIHQITNYYMQILFSIITGVSIISATYRPFWLRYFLYTLVIHIMAWGLAVKKCEYSSSKTHFPFYGVGSNIGYLILSYLLYLDQQYGPILTDHRILIASGISGGLCITIAGLINEKEDSQNEDLKNKITTGVINVVSLFVLIESYIVSAFGELYIPTTVSDKINEIQFGKIGIALLCSACTSFIFKHAEWKYIAMSVPILHICITIYEQIFDSVYTKYLRTFLSYILFDPSKEMLYTHFSKVIRVKTLPDLFIRSVGVVIGHYFKSTALMLTLCCGWIGIVFYADQIVKNDSHLSCERTEVEI